MDEFMDVLNALQKFVVAWMDELWWSMRDRVGALSMIECLANSWQVAGREVGELARRNGLKPVAAVAEALSMLGRDVNAEDYTVQVAKCPLLDRILERGLEYASKCEEFACMPFLAGMKEALSAKKMVVEKSLRSVYVERARLKYKLSKLKAADASDPAIKEQRAKLEQLLKQLQKEPACIFHIK